MLTLCRSRSRRRCSFVRAAPSITARWKDEDEDEEQKKQKEHEREKERELCTYMYMCSYVFVCTFPISHFLYPYSNTIGKMGEIGEKKSENQSRISAISLLMVYAWSATGSSAHFPYSLRELPSTIEGTNFGARAFIAGDADAERQSRMPSGFPIGAEWSRRAVGNDEREHM